MNYSANYQQLQYDPSSQTQQYFDQSINDYYYYAYSNPQYSNAQPYPYHDLTVQTSQHQEQEPNPPGVTAPPHPQQAQNSYYQYHGLDAAAVVTMGAQHGGLDAGVAVVHQPIVQSSYGGIGITNAVGHQGVAQTHLGPKPNVSGRPYSVRGRGRGRGRGRAGAQTHHGPKPNVSGRPDRARGRGRGRALRNHSAAPAPSQTMFIQGGPDIQGGPSQPIPQPYASNYGPTLIPFQGPSQSAPALPPPRLAWCELCRVDCNTLEILDQHKNGKKHQKKLKIFEQYKRVIDKQMEQTSILELKSEVPPQPDQIERSVNQQPQQESVLSETEGNKVAVEEREVEEVKPAEGSGKRVRMDQSEGLGRGIKRKMRGGKHERRVRPFDRAKKLVELPKPKLIPLVCELCNVTCETPLVFQSHLVGKKHKSKAKRFLGGHQETLGHEIPQALRPATQTFQQQNAIPSTPAVSNLHDEGFGANQGTPSHITKIVDLQISTLEANLENATVEATSQPQSVQTNFGASILVNVEGVSKEGHAECGVQSDHSTHSLVAAKTEGVSTATEPVTFGTTLDGASFV